MPHLNPLVFQWGVLDLGFFGTWLVVSLVALRSADVFVRRTGWLLLLALAASLVTIPGVDAGDLGLAVDIVIFGFLAAMACARGATWSILAAAMSFNMLVVTMSVWLIQHGGSDAQPDLSTMTWYRAWAYLTFAAVLSGALRRPKLAFQRETDSLPVGSPT